MRIPYIIAFRTAIGGYITAYDHNLSKTIQKSMNILYCTIRDVNYYKKPKREDQKGWTEYSIRALASDADLSTLRIYVEWPKIPDVPRPGLTNRSWYEELLPRSERVDGSM